MLASIVQPLDLGNVIVIVNYSPSDYENIQLIYSYFPQQFIFCNHTKYVESELINMTQA